MWLTSDTHFGHENIIKYCGRPYSSVEEMDEALIANWNSVVGRKEVIWHLGDFAYKGRERLEDYAKRLNGKIHVLRGNHDNPNSLRAVFGDRFFDVREIGYEGERIFLSHYAHRVWPGSHAGAFHAYGHSHGGLDHVRWGRSMDVGVDVHNYSPVHVSHFLSELQEGALMLHHPGD